MLRLNPISGAAVLAACAYYFLAWITAGRRPGEKSIVPQYEPPAGLSPAMVRYTWKERFDDRTFWSSVLSLVAKNLVTIETDAEIAVLRPAGNTEHPLLLPEEERLFGTSAGRRQAQGNANQHAR